MAEKTMVEAIRDVSHRVILSADRDLKQRDASSRRNLVVGWGVNGVLVAGDGLGGR